MPARPSWLLLSLLAGLGAGLSSPPVGAGAAAVERRSVLVADETREGILWPGGSTLIYRSGFVQGCRAADGFCLSQVLLPRETELCGLRVPARATVYLNYLYQAHQHLSRSAEEGPGVFLTVVGLPAQTIDGYEVEGFASLRCDKRGKKALRIAQLARPIEEKGQRYPTGTTLLWYSPEEGGGLATVWLSTALTLQTQALPAGSYADFSPTGALQELRARDAAALTVGAYTCWVSSASGVALYPSGAVKRCTLASPVRFGGFTGRGETLFFEDGTLQQTTLDADATIQTRAVRAGQVVHFSADGTLSPPTAPK